MKGLVLIWVVTVLASVGSLRYPLIGLYTYVALAVLRPHFIFGFAGNLADLSFYVGVATLIGWALNGFGSWRLGRARSVIVALLMFVVWFTLSATQAIDTSLMPVSLRELSKFVLPVLIGVTMMETSRQQQAMLWTIVLAQGYVGFEKNLEYLQGYNFASEGFGGMDNNCFGASLVTVIGPAIALVIVSRSWKARALAAAAGLLILHTTLLTFSRGAAVGLFAIAVAAFVVMPKRPRYIVAVLAAVLITIRFTGPQLAERYVSIFDTAAERDASSESRVDLWRDCLMVIQQYPILGVGPANWRVIAVSYGWPQGKSAHSVWMETAAETGIPGALLLFSFYALAGLKLWPIARERITDENRAEVATALGVVLSVVGFGVAGQFVSVPGLEVPYYVVMVGAAVLKHRTSNEAKAVAVAPTPRIPSPMTPASRMPARPVVTPMPAPSRRAPVKPRPA